MNKMIGARLVIMFSLFIMVSGLIIYFVSDEMRYEKNGEIVDCYDQRGNKIIGAECQSEFQSKSFSEAPHWYILLVIGFFMIITPMPIIIHEMLREW